MKKDRRFSSSRGFGLGELLLVLLVIAILYFMSSKMLPHSPWGKDKETRKEYAKEGIDLATPGTTLQSIKSSLAASQALERRRAQQTQDDL